MAPRVVYMAPEIWLLDRAPPEGSDVEQVDYAAVWMAIHTMVFRFKADHLHNVYGHLEITDKVQTSDKPGDAAARFWAGMHEAGDNTAKELVALFRSTTEFRNPVYVLLESVLNVGSLFRKMSRGNAIKAIIVQGFGQINTVPCSNCEARWATYTNPEGTHVNHPFFDCVSLHGYFGSCCGNCMFHEGGVKTCTYRILNDTSGGAGESRGGKVIVPSRDIVETVLDEHICKANSKTFVHPLSNQAVEDDVDRQYVSDIYNVCTEQEASLARGQQGGSVVVERLRGHFPSVRHEVKGRNWNI